MYDILIIGAGPAGLASAIKAYDTGVKNILVVERDNVMGGILNQCIHNGFGLHRFKEELTGPEYAQRFIDELKERDIDFLLDTTVINITEDKTVTCLNAKDGLFDIKVKSVIFAMGCRERPRGALNIPGNRPAGVFSAGCAQRLINLEGYMPGKEVVILGSGDIGLIMARRMTLEGAKVKMVCEIMPYSSGLKRNIVQCLDDYNIPLYLSKTVSRIVGTNRVEGVYIADVDENLKVKPETEEFVSCDCLLLSVGLIPENELSTQMGALMDNRTKACEVDNNYLTTKDGVFACGNVLHVHDLVDNVSQEAEKAGENAALYVLDKFNEDKKEIKINTSKDIGYSVPQKINLNNLTDDVKISFRVRSVFENQRINVYNNEKLLASKKRKIMAPGEMENIIIKREVLKDIEKGIIELRIEK